MNGDYKIEYQHEKDAWELVSVVMMNDSIVFYWKLLVIIEENYL